MKTANISKISAEIPLTKKAKFNLSHDNNTTYDWGSVQPLMAKMMLPDSSINVNAEQLTRLAPMVVPTFGRVKLKNVAHFIPCKEIWPNWDAMLSQTKVTRTAIANGQPTASTYVPKTVPYLPNNVIAAWILAGAKVNMYFSGTVGTATENVWKCAYNGSIWSTPTWNAATASTRIYINEIIRIQNTASPTTQVLTPLNYTGYIYNPYRIILRKNGTRILTTGTGQNVLRMPTISTMAPQELPNANGTGWTHSASNETEEPTAPFVDRHISFDGADVIWEYAGSDPTQGISTADRAANSGTPIEGANTTEFDGCKIRLTFKLSSFGKRLRKVLIGLGYDTNLANDDEVSLLPLFAYYKAWWDTFAPKRTKNFYETNAWKIINACMAGAAGTNLLNIFNNANGGDMRDYFMGFMGDLGTCFATEKIDSISAATDSYYNQTENLTFNSARQNEFQDMVEELIRHSGLAENYPNTNEDGSSALGQNYTYDTYGQVDVRGQEAIKLDGAQANLKITQTQIDALKHAYIMINKASVAGKKVEEILRALGMGDYVEECKGKFINAGDQPIKISDVVATAATQEAQLGQYGGRGLGLGNFQFSYSTNRHGYMIILSTIVPESGYINAPAHENEAISFETLYNPEMDGLAYEAIQKKNLVGSPLMNDPSYANTFGFLPTYSQWKFMTNKANGDFSLNSRKAFMTPYTLDKYIPVTDANVYATQYDPNHTGTYSERCAPTFKYEDLANAGEDWRYINKFPWNGNYNRIFSAEGDGLEWSVFSPNNNAFLFLSFEYDNFMVHNVFEIQYWAHMKPIEEAYGTYDEEHGAPNTTISRS